MIDMDIVYLPLMMVCLPEPFEGHCLVPSCLVNSEIVYILPVSNPNQYKVL